MVVKIVIGIVFVPLILLYLLAPLLIKKLQKLPARIKFEPHDEKEFLLSRDDEFHELASQVRTLGFSYIGSSFMEDSHTETNFSLFSNEEDKTTAMVVSMVSDVKSITYIEFTQIYKNGSMLDVSNAQEVPVYPKMDLKMAVRYSEIKDPEELYKIFKKIKKSLKNADEPVTYEKKAGFSTVEEFMAKESDMLVIFGYCDPYIDDGKRALTMKGAYLLTWKSLFPGKKINALLDKAYSKKVLNNA